MLSTSLSRPLVGRVLVGFLLFALAFYGAKRMTEDDPYTTKFLLPMADKTFVGAKVTMNGKKIGEISELDVRDGKAVVTAEIQDDKAPLPAGTRGRIRWESVLGARTLEVLPGKKGNADLPSGSLLTGKVESAELDDLLRSEERSVGQEWVGTCG